MTHHSDQHPDGSWDERVAAFWKAADDERPDAMWAALDVLLAERPAADPAAAFERASLHDFLGEEHAAIPHYRAAIAGGLDAERQGYATIQLASSLRNVGRLDEARALLESVRSDDHLGAAARSFLALTLHDLGRSGEALRLVLTDHAPHVPLYGRALAEYAALLPRFRAEPIRTSRLRLEPLRIDHAAEAAAAFDDVDLHAYIGGSPAGVEELRSRYERQVVGRSADGSQTWLNWMLRRLDTAELIGTVQATVTHAEEDESTEVAWLIATGHQRCGYAREAATEMAAWLRQHHTGSILAHVHPEHDASAGVARALGLRRTSTVVDGEDRWSDG